MKNFSLYGINISAPSVCEAAKYLCDAMRRDSQVLVFTPNFQMLKAASKDKSIAALLNKADLLLPDGIGVSLCCRFHGLPPVSRIAGIDAGYALLRYAAKEKKRVFLLGAERGVAELAAKKLKMRIPNLCICGVHHGYFDKTTSSKDNKAVTDKIRIAAPDVLFVCFGFPDQEQWICDNAPTLPSVRIFMGLGGSLDVWSGKQKRAPLFFRAMNCEWLYRCIREPHRFVPLIKSIF